MHPLTGKVMAYGEDGLRRIWKTPERHEKEYGKLAHLLNKLQAESGSNFSFMGIASSGKEMVFKEINLNGNFRFLVIDSDEYKKEEETTTSFSPKWMDFSRNKDFFDLDALLSLPQPIKDIAVLTETYQNREGADIPVYIVRPVGAVEATSGIVCLHGGPKARTTWTGEDLNDARYWATKGYTTILPQFRGGTGFGIQHLQEGYRQHTTTVINDVFDAAQWAAEKGYIKVDQTVVMGESYGAYLTALILTQRSKEFPFKGGLAYGGFYDVEQDIKKSADLALTQSDIGWGSWTDLEDRTEMKVSSPINYVTNLTVPFIIIHGEEDDNCHYEQAENMSKALKKAAKLHSLIKIKKQGHNRLEENQPVYFAVVEKFFHETLDGSYEPLTPEEKKNKNVDIVRDTTGFFKNFKEVKLNPLRQ
jgi:dipeptidyl aminopeptidase/acylaminoacyl peptidase